MIKLKSLLKLNEVGDASAQAYPVKNLDQVIELFKNSVKIKYGTHDEIFFKTNSNDRYIIDLNITLENNNNFNLDISFSTSNSIETGSYDYSLTNKPKELFKVMSTITTIIKKIAEAIPEITTISFEPAKKESEQDTSALRTDRAKLYMAFIKKAVPNARVMTNGSEITIKIR